MDQLGLIAADRAVALAPRPQLRVAPARVGLTGAPSYFWLAQEPQPVVATASAGGLVVQAHAYPVEYRWDFGEGPGRSTRSIGRPWTKRRPGNIQHLYETKGRYRLGVEIVWAARWRLGSGSWTNLGHFSTVATRSYPVREVESVIVR